jgi:hypothetical protein
MALFGDALSSVNLTAVSAMRIESQGG